MCESEAVMENAAVPAANEQLEYEPPRIIVIGTIRDLTGGSASSGHKDANSQYYW
jgi:hypothetical protein